MAKFPSCIGGIELKLNTFITAAVKRGISASLSALFIGGKKCTLHIL
jgi:hypothetical protein